MTYCWLTSLVASSAYLMHSCTVFCNQWWVLQWLDSNLVWSCEQISGLSCCKILSTLVPLTVGYCCTFELSPMTSAPCQQHSWHLHFQDTSGAGLSFGAFFAVYHNTVEENLRLEGSENFSFHCLTLRWMECLSRLCSIIWTRCFYVLQNNAMGSVDVSNTCEVIHRFIKISTLWVKDRWDLWWAWSRLAIYHVAQQPFRCKLCSNL